LTWPSANASVLGASGMVTRLAALAVDKEQPQALRSSGGSTRSPRRDGPDVGSATGAGAGGGLAAGGEVGAASVAGPAPGSPAASGAGDSGGARGAAPCSGSRERARSLTVSAWRFSDSLERPREATALSTACSTCALRPFMSCLTLSMIAMDREVPGSPLPHRCSGTEGWSPPSRRRTEHGCYTPHLGPPSWRRPDRSPRVWQRSRWALLLPSSRRRSARLSPVLCVDSARARGEPLRGRTRSRVTGRPSTLGHRSPRRSLQPTCLESPPPEGPLFLGYDATRMTRDAAARMVRRIGQGRRHHQADRPAQPPALLHHRRPRRRRPPGLEG
jgi:hypothetical protein